MNDHPHLDHATVVTELAAQAIDYYAAYDAALVDPDNGNLLAVLQGPGFVLTACLGKEAVERYLRRFFAACDRQLPSPERETIIHEILTAPHPYPYTLHPALLRTNVGLECQN